MMSSSMIKLMLVDDAGNQTEVRCDRCAHFDVWTKEPWPGAQWEAHEVRSCKRIADNDDGYTEVADDWGCASFEAKP